MTPRDLIDDLRSRINPAYAAQLGTESYERRLCAEALESQADKLEALVGAVDRCYRMLLSEPDTKGALFKTENILREALAEQKLSNLAQSQSDRDIVCHDGYATMAKKYATLEDAYQRQSEAAATMISHRDGIINVLSARIASAPAAIMDTRDVLGICAPDEDGFPALYALQGKRVRLVLDDDTENAIITSANPLSESRVGTFG